MIICVCTFKCLITTFKVVVVFVYLGAVVGFETPDLGSVREAEDVVFGLIDNGFSYGEVPVVSTPLPCRDYPGNLSILFNNIPSASASLGMVIIVS